MAGNLVISTVNSAAIGVKNQIINGNFAVNQRAVSGTVTLAAGIYGHDRWKAGASGCTYTFATSANVTTLTITAGSLIQVVEGINLFTDTYTLSWTGTATGKIGAGSFSGAGVTGSITGGTNTNIEFSTGTLSLVQLEVGAVVTGWERRSFSQELALCQRYYYKTFQQSVAPATNAGVAGALQFVQAAGASADCAVGSIKFPVTMRSTPSTITIYNTSAANNQFRNLNNAVNWSLSVVESLGESGVGFNGTTAATSSAGSRCVFHITAEAEL